jgi:hypothetical protein
MDKNYYSAEQIFDIEERVETAKATLKELQLRPAVMMQPVNIGDDIFALKPITYLADEKYTDVVSPLTP